MVSRTTAAGYLKLRKALKFMMVSMLTIILVLAAILTWLIFTESGTRQLFSTLARFELLTYQSLQGSISDGLQIQSVNIKTVNVNIGVTELNLSADWSELLYSKLQINELSARNVTIDLPESESETPQKETFNLAFLNDRLIFIPLDVSLQHLSVKQLSINSAGQTHKLHNIELSSRVDQRGISATRLSLHHGKTRLQLQGDVALAPKLVIDLTLNWNSSFVDGNPLAGNARLKGNKKELTISHQSSGNLSSDISIRLTNWLKQPRLSLQGTVDKLSWPLTSKTPPRLSKVVLSAEGDFSALETNIKGQLQLRANSNSAFEVFANISPTELDISKLWLSDIKGGSAEISAQVSWLDNVPRWQGLFNLSNFNGQVIHPLLPQQLVGTLAINGSADTQLQLDIASTNLQGVLQERTFSAQVNARMLGENIFIQQLKANVGDNQLALSGTVEKSRFNITFDSQITDLNLLLPDSQGAIQVSGLLTGTTKKPTLKAQLQGQNLSLYDFSANDITIAIELLDGVFIKDGNRLNAEGLRYQSVYLDQLNVMTEGAWLTPTLWLETVNPLLQISAHSDLQLDKPVLITGRLNRLQVKGEAIGDWQLEQPVSYQAAPSDWSSTPLCLHDNDGRVCLEATGAAGKLNASLSARQLPVSLLNATGLLNTSISGLLDIAVSVTGDRQQHQGQLRLTQSRAETPLLLSADDAANTQISIAGLVADIELNNGALNGKFNARLNDTGSLSSVFEIRQLLAEHSPLSARVDYNIPDLKPYAPLIPEVDALSGELEGYIKLDNSLQQPRLSLFTRLNIPHIYISPLAIEWTDLSAEISTLSGSRQQVNATVTAGEGQLKLAGTLTFTSIDNWLSELHIQGDNALLMDQKNRRILASPDIHITASPTGLNMEGLLRIPEAKINIKPSPNRLTLTSDAVIHRVESDSTVNVAPYRFDLNLAVMLGDKVNFEAYGLKTDVKGKLTLSKQSPGTLLGNGELNLVNGAYQAYGQDLIIERGVIRFTGLLSRPEIDLTASRTVKSIKAGLLVNGPVDNLRTRLYSEPVLPDSEILSYIIRGKPLRSANAADQNALANMLLAYSISQSTPVTSKLTELSGLDEIGLEAEEGVETLGFTLGKYITPRLYARYGIGVIDKLSKVFLQYQLSDKLYLETESGQGQSVDLMYRSR